MAVDVLVLNASHEVLQILPMRKAIKLLFKQSAEVEHSVEGQYLHSVDQKLELPSVIRLKNYVRYVRKPVPYSKKNVLIRDNYVCQYCGESNAKMTVDHIVPQCKGGENSWTNTVACCVKCNSLKANLSLAKIGFVLARKPKQPPPLSFIKASTKRPEWLKYLYV